MMPILSFSLNPEALGELHDALVCLGKFSESASIEASQNKLTISALNSSKSAYASFTLAGKFFSKYQFKPMRPSGGQVQEKFNCKMYSKALLSVFRGRAFDPMRERDTAVEKCDVSVEDREGTSKSRFIVKMFCRHGVLKNYRLIFESVEPMHALFIREHANNCWSISSKTLREFVDHFGPGTEQLDIYSEDGRVSLTSYTEKIMSGNEVLKQPLHTTIAIDTLEFGEFAVEEKLHIVISVKDFKSIIAHAGISNTIVKALYSRPSSPMQITYGDEGISSEFILMTVGETRGSSATAALSASRAGSKRPTRQPLEAASNSRAAAAADSEMPPPPLAAAPSLARSKGSRPSPPPPQPSIQSQALFFPEADDDRRWDPVTYDDEDEEMLLWDQDTGAFGSNSGRRLQSTEGRSQNINKDAGSAAQNKADGQLPPTQRLAPTQRLSGIKGLFD